MKLLLGVGLLLLGNLAVANEEPVVDAVCETTTSFGSTYQSDRCFFNDEVMVGLVKVEPITIRCARLRTTCNRKVVAEGDAVRR